MTRTLTPPPLIAPTRPRFSVSDVLTTLGPLIGLVFVFGLFSALRPDTFLRLDNLQIMLIQTAVVGTAAIGMTLIIISGGIDLSVGSQVALTCVGIAVVMGAVAGEDVSLGLADAPWWLALVGIATALVVGSLAGLVNGLLITSLRMMPFIVTLGTLSAYRGLSKRVAGEQMVLAPSTWLGGLLRYEDVGWMLLPPGVWLMIALALIMAAVLRYTRFGRHVFAIGSNEQTARLCGVSIGPTKVGIYALAGLFAGLAGLLQFAYLTVGDPTTATGMELDIIAAVVIGGASLSGGQGSIFGSLVGALIMTIVSNGCSKMGMPNSVQQMVTGGIIIFAVALDRLRHRKGT